MKKLLFLLLILVPFIRIYAQDTNISEPIQIQEQEETTLVKNTFKSAMLVNAHTIKNPRKNQLLFIMSHRFGYVNSGFSDLFGLDNATTRFGFEYGLTGKLSLGIGRSNYKRNYDFFGKYVLLQQITGADSNPISISVIGSTNISSAKWPNDQREYLFAHRMSYSAQLLFARKFNNSLSLQLMPTYIHRNLVPNTIDQNDVLVMGAGGRIKVSKLVALTGEYFYLLPGETAKNFINPLSVGVDLETSGHVFQLFFTNAASVYEAAYVAETTDRWLDGNFRFGFNITRTF